MRTSFIRLYGALRLPITQSGGDHCGGGADFFNGGGKLLGTDAAEHSDHADGVSCLSFVRIHRRGGGTQTDPVFAVFYGVSVGAARLAGNGNFLPAERTESGVKLTGWDVVLPLDAPADNATVVIPDAAVTLGSGPHTAYVRRVIRDLNGSVVQLCPVADADVPPLRVKVATGAAPAEGSTVAMDILAEKCFCYRRA